MKTNVFLIGFLALCISCNKETNEKYHMDEIGVPRLLLIYPKSMKTEIINHGEEEWEKRLYVAVMGESKQ